MFGLKIRYLSFFFGLILASIWLVGKTIKKRTPTVIISLLIGAAIAFFIASIQTVGSVDSKLFIVLSGAIAICAMILPGISGIFSNASPEEITSLMQAIESNQNK